MPLFRLLHCSDLHLSVKPNRFGIPDLLPAIRAGGGRDVGLVSSCDPAVVDAMAAFAYHNRDGYDAIVLSGDLATTGNDDDLSEVVSLLEAPAALGYLTEHGRPTLRAAGKPILLIPGNHDRFGSALLGYPPGDTRFDDALRRYWTARQGAQELSTCRRGAAALVVLGADLTLDSNEVGEGPWGYLGQGRAYPGRVEALRRLTGNVRQREPNATIIWVVHFDPTADEPTLSLLDQSIFRTAVEAEGIPAVLCGHTHRNRRRVFAGGALCVCGTTSQHYAPEGNALNLVEIEAPDDGAPATVRMRAFRFDGYSQFVPAL